jgi:hypothetical protein
MHRTAIHRIVMLGAVVVAAVASGGCTGDKVATVSGTVTYKGKPLPGGTITFLSEDRTRQEMAPIKADGSYTAAAVPTGKVLVGVQPAGKKMSAVIKGETKDLSKPPKDSGAASSAPTTAGEYVNIPAYLHSPATSKIALDVDTNSKSFDITLPEK